MADLAPYDCTREADLVGMWRESFEHGVGVVDPHSIDQQAVYFRDQVLPQCAVRLALDGTKLVGFIAATPTRVEQLYVRVGALR